MKKYSSKLLSFLLICIMMMSCSVPAFADEIDYTSPLPVKDFVYNTYAVPSYEYALKFEIPCSGTVTFTAKPTSNPTGSEYVTRDLIYNEVPDYSYGLTVEPVKDFYIRSKTTTGTKQISLTKGTYYLRQYEYEASGIKYTFKPKASSVSSATNSASKAMTIKWNKIAGVTGYQIQYSTKSDFSSKNTVTVKNTSTTAKTIKNLKKGNKYYVRVRTYTSIDGTKCYSNWSAKKSVKITK